MSYCYKCGSKFESGKFRCPNCGSPLAHEPSGRGPSFWLKYKEYKNLLILIILAVVIVAVRAAAVLTAITWLFVAGLLIAVLVLWLRDKYRKGAYHQQKRPNNGRTFGRNKNNVAGHKNSAKVIPFRKKPDTKSKAKED